MDMHTETQPCMRRIAESVFECRDDLNEVDRVFLSKHKLIGFRCAPKYMIEGLLLLLRS
jgi:hypothetical protein